ncbi:transcriptional regulator [Niallia circulans]|uniref:FadR/GntR family transcriptional regulator n=1 Tax=Niallia circulans TaxID=1397 RepID=UPI00077C7EDA|nr:FadR/GntR family transcriptional regulator [Niallia circulans]MDR4316055.1 FadR family transcriptional regulator [Niallia circulans]MED4244676.1 FadR/GntR family transcriptional regulator [Niallia circulans]QKH60510.1 FadR family transcriptional regulator [Niallia circulans]SPU12550.1 transcriptional regulator [Niallia circulans]
MEFKQIRPKKIYEEIAEALHEGIRSGALKPGEKLASVQQLAENFQVSRSAVREALSALKAKGLIEMKQGEGTYVKRFEADQISFSFPTAILMKEKDLNHLLEVRRIMEVGAAAAAAAAANKRTNEDLQKMKQALEEMKQANGVEELGEKSDLNFHLGVAAASQNPLLVNLLLNVSDIMQEAMKETRRLWLFSKQTTTERLYEEHLTIYESILERNAEKASEAMLYHLQKVEAVLQKYFAEKEQKV